MFPLSPLSDLIKGSTCTTQAGLGPSTPAPAPEVGGTPSCRPLLSPPWSCCWLESKLDSCQKLQWWLAQKQELYFMSGLERTFHPALEERWKPWECCRSAFEKSWQSLAWADTETKGPQQAELGLDFSSPQFTAQSWALSYTSVWPTEGLTIISSGLFPRSDWVEQSSCWFKHCSPTPQKSQGPCSQHPSCLSAGTALTSPCGNTPTPILGKGCCISVKTRSA